MGRKQAWYVLEIRLIRHQVRGIFQLLSSSTASNKKKYSRYNNIHSSPTSNDEIKSPFAEGRPRVSTNLDQDTIYSKI